MKLISLTFVSAIFATPAFSEEQIGFFPSGKTEIARDGDQRGYGETWIYSDGYVKTKMTFVNGADVDGDHFHGRALFRDAHGEAVGTLIFGCVGLNGRLLHWGRKQTWTGYKDANLGEEVVPSIDSVEYQMAVGGDCDAANDKEIWDTIIKVGIEVAKVLVSQSEGESDN